MKISRIILTCILAITSIQLSAQKYTTKTGLIKFFSHTDMEDIKAENRKVVSALDSKTGAMEFLLLMKAFDFTNELMEQHFNESYAESSLFPKAGFKGSIVDISKVDFTKDGTYNVDIKGKLTIKDVTKEIKTTGVIVVKGGKVTATSKLKIKPADYNFKIPSISVGKIAEEIDVDIIMDYSKS